MLGIFRTLVPIQRHLEATVNLLSGLVTLAALYLSLEGFETQLDNVGANRQQSSNRPNAHFRVLEWRSRVTFDLFR